jgi:hypothetical protein
MRALERLPRRPTYRGAGDWRACEQRQIEPRRSAAVRVSQDDGAVGRLEKKRAHRAVEAARACRAKGKTVGAGTGLGALDQKTTAGTSTAPAGQADGVDACG